MSSKSKKSGKNPDKAIATALGPKNAHMVPGINAADKRRRHRRNKADMAEEIAVLKGDLDKILSENAAYQEANHQLRSDLSATTDKLNVANATGPDQFEALKGKLEDAVRTAEYHKENYTASEKNVKEGAAARREERAEWEIQETKMRERISELKSRLGYWITLLGKYRSSLGIVNAAELIPVATAEERFSLESERLHLRRCYHELIAVPLTEPALELKEDIDGRRDFYGGEMAMMPSYGDRQPREYRTGEILTQTARH